MSRFTTTAPTRRSNALSPAARALGLALLLGGCAGYSPGDLRAGQTEADVRARMGEPTGRHALADGGSLVEYARGPMGKHTYMIDVDASGRVRSWQQVLDDVHFDAITPGMPAADVRRRLGRPSETRGGWRGLGEVWSYRYETVFCRWFVVWIVDSRVREAGMGIDPQCDEPRDVPGP